MLATAIALAGEFYLGEGGGGCFDSTPLRPWEPSFSSVKEDLLQENEYDRISCN